MFYQTQTQFYKINNMWVPSYLKKQFYYDETNHLRILNFNSNLD